MEGIEEHRSEPEVEWELVVMPRNRVEEREENERREEMVKQILNMKDGE